jgi:phosphatidylglycerol:prolipoprotein diacylglycerol transferase
MAGLVLGWLYIRRLVDEERLWRGPAPLLPDQIDSLLLWVTIGVVLGGRLGFFLLYEPQHLAEDPLVFFRVWNGGMAFHGGVIGTGAAMWLFSRRNNVSFLSTADLVCAAVPIGLLFGRIANFINAELYGRVSTVPWGMVFPGAGPDPRHPSQLYEAALEGAVLLLLLRWLTHRRLRLQAPGTVAGVFLIGYGAIRTLLEFFREVDVAWLPNVGWLTIGMSYSLAMVAAGLIVLAIARRGEPATGRP